MEHALVVARMSNIPEDHVRSTHLNSLLFAAKDRLMNEALTQMTKGERSICCLELIFTIEASLNGFVNK